MCFLDTARLRLRPLEPLDADGPYPSWLNDREVCAGNSHHLRPYSREEARAYIAKVAGSASDLVLAMVIRDDNQHVGNVALTNLHPLYRRAEFSILVGSRDHQGRGYGIEAGRALFRHGFLAMNLQRIECGTFSTNVGMQKLAQALGMKQEGVRRRAAYKDGAYVDVLEYGLLREELQDRDSR